MSKETSVTDLDTTSHDAAAAATSAAKAAKGEKQDAVVLGSAQGTKFEITIASSENDATPVKVGINGNLTLIPRNTRVTVGEDVMDVLNNAVVEVFTHTSNGVVASSAPRHSISVHNVIKG